MKFKSDIELQAGLKDGSNDIGTAGQILSSTGSQTNWIDQSSIVASEAKLVVIECKNTSGVTISKGTPVYQTGTVGATDVIEIDAADASDEDKMAAIGLLQTDLVNNAFGKVVITGELLNITTSPIDGVTPVTGDTIYVKSGGGLTLTKPTGVNFIQNIGLVGKVSGGNSGSITVSSIMRSNDVPTPLYIDHTNQRLGIGTTTPGAKLDISSTGTGDSMIIRNDDASSSAAPVLMLLRDSASAADGDYLGQIKFKGNSDTGAERVYAKITAKISDATNGAEDSLIETAVKSGGSNLIVSRQTGTDLKLINGIGLQVDGNVGIGTTSPGNPLHIVGNTAKLQGSGSGYTAWFITNSGTGNSGIYYDAINGDVAGGDYGFIGQNNSGYMSYNIGTSSPMPYHVFTGGNVGIGTTSPSKLLDASGDGLIQGKLTVGNSSYYDEAGVLNVYGSGKNQLTIQASDNSLDRGVAFRNSGGAHVAYIAATNTTSNLADLVFGVSDATETNVDNVEERMRITSAGNVGIGTDSPSVNLDIEDSSNVIVDMNTTTANANTTIRLQESGTVKSTIGYDGTNNGLILTTGGFTAGNGIFIDDSQNVGIGTTSPSDLLHIKSTTTDARMIIDGADGFDAELKFFEDGNVKYTTGFDAATDSYVIGTVNVDTNKRLVINNSGALQLPTYTAGTLVSDASGNITVSSGGGAGGPYLPLSAGSSYPLTDTLFGTNTSMSGNGTYAGSMNLGNGAGTGEKHLTIGNGSTDSGYRYIDLVGDTTYTDYGLRIIRGNGGANTTSQILHRGTGDFSIQAVDSANLIFTTGGSEKMRITSDGKVGIGTDSPITALEVNGDIGIGRVAGGYTFREVVGGGERASIKSNASNELIFSYGASTEAMRIKSNGNVGINNTNPVNGKLLVTSTEENLLNTVRIQHTRSDSNFSSNALEVDMNLSGADTTTADRTNKGIFVDLDSSADGDAANEHRIHGVSSDVRFTGFSDIVRGGYFYAESNNSTEKTAQLAGVYGQAIHDASNAAGGVSNMFGVFGYSSIQNLGDVDNAFGVYGLVSIGDNRDADVGVTKAVEGEITIDKSTALNYGTMIGISSIIDNNEGTVPNFGNQYLFKGDYQGTKGDNAWGIYTEGDKNYFEGKVGIGTTSPDEKLHITDSSGANIILNTNTGANNSGVYMSEGSDSTPTQNGAYVYYDAAGNAFKIATGATSLSDRLTIARDSGNVGIGTTSPGAKLHVRSTASNYVATFKHSTGTGYAPGSILLEAGQGNARGQGIYHYNNVADENWFTGVPYNVDSKKWIVANKYSTTQDVDTAQLNYALLTIDSDTGNVGIGTTSPSTKLQVDSSTAFSLTNGSGDTLLLTNDSTVSAIGAIGPSIGFGNMNNNNRTSAIAAVRTGGDHDNMGLAFFTHPSNSSDETVVQKMTITHEGNVGIGTTSPDAKLDVNGAGNFTGGTVVSGIDTHTDVGVAIAKGKFLKSNDGNYLRNIIGQTSGGIIEIGQSGTSLISDINLKPGSSGNINFYGSGGLDMRIASTGNVGIGTTSPGVKLVVNGGGDNEIAKFVSTDSVSQISISDDTTTSYFGSKDGLSFISQTGGTPGSGLVLDSSGNVGIGTTSPGQKLDVNGSVNIDGTLFVNTTNNHIRLVDTDNTGNFSVGVNTNFQIRDITANTTPLTIRAGTPGNTILTTSTGRVGIGLTNPTVTLHVGGFARLNGGLQMNATNATIYQILDSDLRFGTNNTERMRIDNTGNVGIGTTTPGDKLHVNGTIRVQAPATSDWALLGYNSLGNAPSGLWFDNGDGELLLRDDSGNLNVRLRSDTSSYINGGNLGLGTTSPSQKLTVNSGRVLISNTSTPIYIKAGSTYKSWVHHIGGGDEYIFAPSTADNGETWDWSNQTRFDTSGVVQANNFVLASDKRLKTNIKNVSGKRIKANWKTFEMIADKTKAQRHGVIAQELEEVHPEFVRTNSEGIKSVAYTDLLIAKIAELEARLEKLEK